MALDAVHALVEARLSDACVQLREARLLSPMTVTCRCVAAALPSHCRYIAVTLQARLLSPRTANFQQRFEVGVDVPPHLPTVLRPLAYLPCYAPLPTQSATPPSYLLCHTPFPPTVLHPLAYLPTVLSPLTPASCWALPGYHLCTPRWASPVCHP